MVVIELRARDDAAFHCTQNRIAGIGIMTKVAEFTGSEIIPEVDETAGNKFWRQMPQTKFPYPWGIN